MSERDRSSRRTAAWTVLKVLAGTAFLLLSVWGIDWQALPRHLAAAKPGWLALALLAVLVGLALRILRWRVLLTQGAERPALPAVSEAYLAGQAANIVMPFRSGEVIRLGLLAGQGGVGLAPAGISIVMEKSLDLLALAGLALLLLPSLPASVTDVVPGWLFPAAGVTVFLLALGLLACPWLIERIRSARPGARGWGGQLIRVLDEAAAAVNAMRRPSIVIPAVTLTLLAWGVMIATNALLFRALDLPLGATAAGLVMLLVMIGLLPALMPGNIGPFYFFARLALLPFQVDPQLAIAFSILLHLLVTLPPLLGGGLMLLTYRRRSPSRS
ncbi:MAG: lysylphosphatidylglycerol synthase transmembrane domain-containing protein [Chloroflexi bacterium]|nr:lysylphosphatidylglycerol synthase transmembrane domain-containing protein [Chloroflexota bacterium]